jgi:hypothetical protein
LPHRKGLGFELRRELPQDDDVKRPEQRADQLQRIARADLEAASRRKQVRAADSESHRRERKPVETFAPSDKQNDGDENNV